MKSDMCFPSTEEFLPLAWLFFTAMFSSWPSSGWYLIVPVPTVQSGNPVTASPRWSRSAGAIVRHGLRTVGCNRDGFLRTWTGGLRNDQGRSCVMASSSVSFPASGVARLHTLRSSQLSSGTASGLLRRPAAPRSSASTGPSGLGLPKQIERPERAPACREISFGSLRES